MRASLPSRRRLDADRGRRGPGRCQSSCPQARQVDEGEVDDEALQEGVDPDQLELWTGALDPG